MKKRFFLMGFPFQKNLAGFFQIFLPEFLKKADFRQGEKIKVGIWPGKSKWVFIPADQGRNFKGYFKAGF